MKERVVLFVQKRIVFQVFENCVRVLTRKLSYEDYMEFIIGFSRNGTAITEKLQLKHFRKKVGNDIGYFIGKELLPGSCKEVNKFI